MSATLTWLHAGPQAKTGTTNAACIDDLVSLINSKSGDAAYKWQVASSNNGASPLYVVLKPKSGAAGRILYVIWSSAPAGVNTAILEATPTTNGMFCAYFPSGNVDTPSNLTAASGTILGNDTGCTKVGAYQNVSTLYAASVQWSYFDSDEAVFLLANNPGAVATYASFAGNILIDAADVVYPAVLSTGTAVTLAAFGATTNFPFIWVGSDATAGTAATGICRTNYGSTDRMYYTAWTPTGIWANQAVGSTDVLTDTSISKAWFVPVQLLGQIKGEGFVLKLRQMAYGPGTTGPFSAYSTTGPVVAARQVCSCTAGGTGYPWLTNFKL